MLNEPGSQFEHESQEEHFSEEQLIELISDVRTHEDELMDSHFEQTESNPSQREELNKVYLERKQNLLKEFVEKLKAEKQKFRSIFETEKGSIYFVLHSGKTLRIRFGMNLDGIEGFSLQPMMGKIFYVEENEWETIRESRRSGYETLLNKPLRTSSLISGVYPVELNAASLSDEIVFEEDQGNIILRGSRPKKSFDREPDHQIYGGIHVGHKVSSIIKT